MSVDGADDPVKRFLRCATASSRTAPDEQTVRAVADFLLDLADRAGRGEDINPLVAGLAPKEGQADRFSADKAYIDTPEFGLVRDLVAGWASYEETRIRFAALHPASESRIDRWIEEIRPRAERVHEYLEALKALSVKANRRR